MRISFFILCILYLAGVSLSGCRTKYVPVKTVRTDSVFLEKIRKDSIFVRDSVYVREKGDTVYLYKYKYVYKDKLTTDTVYVERTDSVEVPVPVERKLSRWERWKMEFGGMSFGVCIGLSAVIVWLIKKRK